MGLNIRHTARGDLSVIVAMLADDPLGFAASHHCMKLVFAAAEVASGDGG